MYKAYPQENPVWAGLVCIQHSNRHFEAYRCDLKLIYPASQLEALITAAADWAKTMSEDEAAMIGLACPPPHHKVCAL